MNTRPGRRDALWSDASSAHSGSNQTCSEGCLVRRCRHGHGPTPCCVKRLQAEWPIDCRELPYGCAFNTSSAHWQRGSVIVDLHALPRFEPSDSCPSIRDVLNTASSERWRVWQDCAEGCWDEQLDEQTLGEKGLQGLACGAGCIMTGCQLRRGAPCCTKRAAARWDVPCELLPYGCATGRSWDPERAERLTELTLPDPSGISVTAGSSVVSVVDLQAVPLLEPSEHCPSFEDVLNTGRKQRWQLWDDVRSDGSDRCADRCYQPRGCASGSHAPCCVVRRRAVWTLPSATDEPHGCKGLPHGCSGRLARYGLTYVDWGSFARAVFVSGWAAFIARWICAVAAVVAGLLLLATAWLASRRRLRRRLPMSTLGALIIWAATVALQQAAAQASASTDRSVETVLSDLGEPHYVLQSL